MLSWQPLTLPATISEMYSLARDYALDVAPLGLRSLPEIYSFVARVPYVRDVDAPECEGAEECVKRPIMTMTLGGDCDDKAILAGAFLTVIGVPWRIVTTSDIPSGEMTHTYVEVYWSGRWLPFDATIGDIPMFTEKPFLTKKTW